MADGRDPNGAADGRRRPGRSEQGLRVLEAALVDAVVPPSLLAAHRPAAALLRAQPQTLLVVGRTAR